MWTLIKLYLGIGILIVAFDVLSIKDADYSKFKDPTVLLTMLWAVLTWPISLPYLYNRIVHAQE